MIEVSKDNSTVVLNNAMLVESRLGEYTNALTFMCGDAIIKLEYMLKGVEEMKYRLNPPTDILSAFTTKILNKKLRIIIEEDIEDDKIAWSITNNITWVNYIWEISLIY